MFRGTTYTFEVEGGSDPSVQARYHPFYITDSDRGGYLAKSIQEQQVMNQLQCTVHLVHFTTEHSAVYFLSFLINELVVLTTQCCRHNSGTLCWE